MNGRALNEKAIEVSPSSNRVLERAGEILTPFPPSKNRPRPGDWTCPSCGFSNFQRRTACFRCSYPAMSAPPSADPSMGFSYGYPNAGPPMMQHYSHGPPESFQEHGRLGPFSSRRLALRCPRLHVPQLCQEHYLSALRSLPCSSA